MSAYTKAVTIEVVALDPLDADAYLVQALEALLATPNSVVSYRVVTEPDVYEGKARV